MSTSIDTVLEVRLRHEPGTLARLATAIAGEGGLLCEIETLRVGDEHTLREITVETRHGDDVARVIASLVKKYGVGEVLCHDPDPQASARAIAIGAHSTSFVELMGTAEIVVAVTGRGKLIPPELIRKGQIVLALSNPDPEIDPKAALAAGAALASDGRTINNALAFPGLMRGAIEARARSINHDMMIEAGRLIASRTEPGELVPSPLARELHEAIAAGVVRHARKTGMAGTAAP